jgi:nucleoside-diphosphate-sugar epimerase
MKLVIIGGTGLIGSKLVAGLRERGYDAVAASPDTGVNTLTGHELIRQGLTVRNDPREVVVDPHARYFGAELGERSLVPADDARLGEMRLEEWLGQPALQR